MTDSNEVRSLPLIFGAENFQLLVWSRIEPPGLGMGGKNKMEVSDGFVGKNNPLGDRFALGFELCFGLGSVSYQT